MADIVEYEVDGRVATVTLNRPEKLNAITSQLQDELLAALRSELRTPLETAVALSQERMERATRDDGAKLREEIARMSKDSREELSTALQRFSESSALTLKS